MSLEFAYQKPKFFFFSYKKSLASAFSVLFTFASILVPIVVGYIYNMNSFTEIKRVVDKTIETEKGSLEFVISRNIWKNPELMFHEVKAHQLLTDFLEEKGFQVEREYCLPTAFRAEYGPFADDGSIDNDQQCACICIICEYDALPEIGHACGHNLISESAIGAALAVKAVMDAKLTNGKLVVMGTPAEEGGGGKVLMLKAGAFKYVDFALMVHPASENLLCPNLLSIIRMIVEYTGREAHAAIAPWQGLNALDAAVACYSNISLYRQQMKPSWRIHGVINKGGIQPNIIPAESQLTYYLRAPDMREADVLKTAAIRCFEGAARATGCKVSYRTLDNSYESFFYITPLQQLYKKHAESYGIHFSDDWEQFTGSTDMGNISQAVPSIHPTFKIETLAANHTREFCAAAGSPKAQVPTLIAAKSIALTAIELFNNAELQNEIRTIFRNRQ